MLLGAAVLSFAQNGPTVTRVRYNDTIWHDKGFDLYIGAGMFIGNKYNANYYNGSNLNECNFEYVFSNEYWHREIVNQIVENYQHIASDAANQSYYQHDPALNTDFNWDLHYKLKTMVTLGVRYKIGKGWGISLSYSFSRLTTSAMMLLSVPGLVPGNDRPAPEIYFYGKEDRSMIDLSASYVFNLRSIVRPFVELGVQFNYAKAKMFDAVVGDKNFTMLDPYYGEGYYPGAQAYDVTYGGPGFGFAGSAGLKIVVAKGVSLDPTFYFALQRLAIYQTKNGPEEYRMGNRFTPNYGVLLRVTMNDFFFSKNK